jgi:hypothetical protein
MGVPKRMVGIAQTRYGTGTVVTGDKYGGTCAFEKEILPFRFYLKSHLFKPLILLQNKV